MDIEYWRHFLLVCLAVNYSILMFWFFLFVFCKNFIRNLHRRWFSLTDSTCDAIHYAGMAFYKIIVFVFNLAPLVALYWVPA